MRKIAYELGMQRRHAQILSLTTSVLAWACTNPPSPAAKEVAGKALAPPQTSPSGPPAAAPMAISAASASAAQPLPKSPPPKPVPRIYALSELVKVFSKPQWDSPVMGLIHGGQGVRIRPGAPELKAPFRGPCSGGWKGVEPFGFVCANHQTTLDPKHKRLRALQALIPNTGADFPFRVGTSVGGPRYSRVPLPEEQSAFEPGLARYLKHPPGPTLGLGSVSLKKAGHGLVPWLRKSLFDRRRGPLVSGNTFPGMKIAWTQEFDAHGRTWLITPKHQIVPKDKVRLRKRSQLRGISLKAGSEYRLPLVFVHGKAVKTYRLKDKQLSEDKLLPKQAFVNATGETKRFARVKYRKLASGAWVKAKSVRFFTEPDEWPPFAKGKQKWIGASIARGALVAYIGKTPVFATATSPGTGGANGAVHGTPTGVYRVYLKLITADMAGRTGKRTWRVREVPWIAYFQAGYALHGAWWHDGFGTARSHGCLNLTPGDARFLFGWLDPQLPEDWYAVATGPKSPVGKGTIISIGP